MPGTQAGQMRLQREARMAKKDLATQIKSKGKITDNFICLPDPDNIYTWYYIVWGLEEPAEYKGGYYLGKVTVPDNYPQKAPNIKIITENGRFRTHGDGICLSISDFHPESWNPAWKVNQIIIGLLSFWVSGEYTYGAVESYDFNQYKNPYKLKDKERLVEWAMNSRDAVRDHEIFKKVFADYVDAIGINEEVNMPEWEELKLTIEKNKKKIQEEEEEKKR